MAFIDVGAIKLSKGGEGKTQKLYINFQEKRSKEGSPSFENLVALRDAIDSYIKSPTEYGLSLQIEKPEVGLRRLAELGYIEEDALQKRIEAIPSFVKYHVKLITDDK